MSLINKAVEYRLASLTEKKKKKFIATRKEKLEKLVARRKLDPKFRTGVLSRSALTDVDYAIYTKHREYELTEVTYEYKIRDKLVIALEESTEFMNDVYGIDFMDVVTLVTLELNEENNSVTFKGHHFDLDDVKAKVKYNSKKECFQFVGDNVVRMGYMDEIGLLIIDIGYGFWVFSSFDPSIKF